MIRVVRVPAIPGGPVIYIDDLPDSCYIWVCEDYMTAQTAALIERVLCIGAECWMRAPIALAGVRAG